MAHASHAPPQALVSQLQALLGADAVLTSVADLHAYGADAYPMARGVPDVVALPATTQQVAAIVRLCVQCGIPFLPRGAGTGLSGGATPVRGGVVIGLARMNAVLRLDAPNRVMTAQAGCVNAHLSAAAAAHGLHYAPDPSSQGVCTIGGNVAENAGGPHTLKYGVTTNHVLGLRLVTAQGAVVDVGGEVADSPGYDLVGLMVGSEGTLGVVTEVTLRLTPLPNAWRTLLAVFADLEQAARAVSDIIARGITPCALEMIDDVIIGAIEDAFHPGFPRDAAALLIVELDGFDAGLDRDAGEVDAALVRNGALRVRRATTAQERADLWMARKKGVGTAGRLAPSIVTQDGMIPRSRLPEVLRYVKEVSREQALRIGNVFHAGDGNLHPCVLFDGRDPDQVLRMAAAGEAILRRCVEVGGSITGEHGVGVEKLDAMRLVFTDSDLACMRRIKGALDPAGLCNPGKLLPQDGGGLP